MRRGHSDENNYDHHEGHGRTHGAVDHSSSPAPPANKTEKVSSTAAKYATHKAVRDPDKAKHPSGRRIDRT